MMGLAYYRVDRRTYADLQTLIAAHEADMLGPRARGYWFETPSDYPYQDVQNTARTLDSTARSVASEALELSENEAAGLSLMGIALPDSEQGDSEFNPSLFFTSLDPDAVQTYMQIVAEQLGTNPDKIARNVRPERSDSRSRAYYQAQIAHLRSALPKVWRFHERASSASEAVVVVDLRARDVFIPDAVELDALYA